MGCPQSVQIEHIGEKLQIIYRWRNNRYAIFLIVAAIWLVYSLSPNGDFNQILSVESSPVTIFSFMVGIFVAYYGLAGMLNASHIEVDSAEIRITEKPLPWARARKVARADVQQLYCMRMVSRGRYGSAWYGLTVLRQDGRSIKIVHEIVNYEAARCLERQIEQYWDIPDSHVPGEARPEQESEQ